MRLTALAAALILIAVPAIGGPRGLLPTLGDVTGVTAGDTLNIRERPDAKAAVVATLPAGARGVEVVAERRGWALVSTPERSGWVNARYLKLRTDVWDHGALPATLSCSGTEPFWSLRQLASRLVFETPGRSRTLDRRAVLSSEGAASDGRAVIAGDKVGRMTAVIRPAQCSDGMSDRVYGLSATLLFDGSGSPSRMLTGCCRIAP